MKGKSFAVLTLAALAMTAIAPPTEAGGDPEKGAVVFKKCMACHRISPGAKSVVGPPLNGVIGRKAGSIDDYSYSNANKNSGLVFDAATLTEYLKSPRAMMPGTKMAFAGLKKDDEIADVIAYLATFDAAGNTFPPAE